MAKSKRKTKSKPPPKVPHSLQNQLREVRIAKAKEDLRGKQFENDREAGQVISEKELCNGLTGACVQLRSLVIGTATDVIAWVPNDAGPAKAAIESSIRHSLEGLRQRLIGK